MSDSSDAIGLVGTAVGLGITVAALGLALNFTGEAARGFKDQPRRRRQTNDYDDIFDYQKSSKKKSRNEDIFAFDW